MINLEHRIPAAEELLDRVMDICPFPATAQRLMVLANDDAAPLASIVEAIFSDSALATQVLSAANSAAFRAPGAEPIRDLHQAIVRIGLQTLRSMAGAMALLASFATRDELTLDLNAMSAVSGSIASTVAPAKGEGRGLPFTCGLLCEVGSMACLVVDGAGYVELWHRTAGSSERWSAGVLALRDELEVKRYGATTGTIGARLLRRHQLPDEIAVAIEVPMPPDPSAPLIHRATAFARVVTPVLVANAHAPIEGIMQLVGEVAGLTSLVELDAAELTGRCLAAAANAERLLRAARGRPR